MDWSNYSDAAQRETNKMYDDIQVTKWDVVEGKLVPMETSALQEKAGYVNSDRGSNKYNITQTIAETFGVFCVYEYKCTANGQFVKTYYDEEKKCYMTGRTAVFYNRAIKTDNPFYMDYQKNLQSISRTCDTSEIYTKLFVDPIQSDTMTDGYITIANTEATPLMDEFILNFDYLYSKGSITEYQKNFIDEYSVELHDINNFLRELGNYINLATVELNNKKAEKAGAEKSISAIQEELIHYQTLKNNDVTNTPIIKDKDNSYSVVFVNTSKTDIPYYQAEIRLEGVLNGSINGYDTYEYKKPIFSADNLISSNDYKPVPEGDTNMYVVLDDDDYAKGLYTGNAEWFKTEEDENSYSLNASYMIYLALEYSPHNKYVDVCNRFERMITKNREKIAACDEAIEHIETILEERIKQQTEILQSKERLNQKLERIMGPALREGHWAASDYEDIGRKTEVSLASEPLSDAIYSKQEVFSFDTTLFEDEEKGYYYASVEDANNETETYYDYIDITDYIENWKDKNPEDLVLYLTYPEFNYTVTESQYEGLAAGKYFVIYNMTKYYFELTTTLNTGDSLRLRIPYNLKPTLEQKLSDASNWTNINVSTDINKDEALKYANLSDAFEGLNKYLGTYKIYPNAGFIYAFKHNEGKMPSPILLLNSAEINYSIYNHIWYSFGTEEMSEIDLYPKKVINTPFDICYPRIIINKDNVNYDDDLLTITPQGKEALVKFEDYSTLLREGRPYFTLKVTDKTSPYSLLNSLYTILYRVSQANEMLYRDALEVARENSRPRFSYDVSIAQLPNTVESYELGQLGYINDSALGIKAAKGYISSITLVLDNPKDDEIQIQNYKTKFEDLFATITASSEAMKSNQQSYDIAASIINPSTGGIQGSILQDSFNKNKVELTYSNTQVHIDDTDGITLTNSEPYSNGVYGQVVMRGGGIYLSNTVDNNYERVWSTGITPNGINASMITTGQLDANLVRILAGNNVAFQWNSEGIYAYKRDENNQFLPNTYVRYSDKGLQYIDNGDTIVDLGWNGLAINSQEGAVSLTGEDGLIVYDGLKNAKGTNRVVSLGRFGEDGSYEYGLKLFKKDGENYVETLSSTNEGQLWLKDYLTVGAEGAGVSGVNNEDNLNSSVRFWAGKAFNEREEAPFRVLHNGSVYASKITIGTDSFIGGITAGSIGEIITNEGGVVRIADGKVTANSIVSYAITATHIAANSIETQHLTADSVETNHLKTGVITTDKLASNFDLEIDAGRSINITANGSFTIASENFNIDAEGNVFLNGEITAESGSIGGWDIGETSLHSGLDTGYVALSSDTDSNYRIWAGDTIAEEAPFSVEKDGTVTLTKIRALGEPDSNGNQSEKIISLYSQPLWAIWGNYYNRVTGFTAEQATDGTVTLTITRQSAEALTVNFKKAVVDSSNYYIQFNGGGSTNFSASLMRSGSTSSSTGISAYANLKLNLNKAQSTVTVVPTGGSAIASISVKDVYNSVTVDSIDVDGTVTFTSGNYAQIPVTAIASNTLKMMTTLSVDCAKVYNKGISDAKSKITLSFNPEQDITLDYGKSVDVKATVLYDNTSMGVSDYIKVTAPEAPAKPTNFSVTGSIGSNIYTYNMTADYVYRNNEESSSAGTFIAKEAYDNGVAAGKTRYEPTTISATSSYSGNNEYAVAITAKNSAGATVGTGSHTVDARDAYDDGCDAEAKSLALSQTANKTLAYGESITIKATTTNNTTGKSVKITAPANNFANGAASVTIDTVARDGEASQTGKIHSITIKATASNGATKTQTFSTTCDTIYQNGYNTGYEDAKDKATIKYTGTEQARIISSGSTEVTIVDSSGKMITGTFVRGGTPKTYNTGAYIAYE